MLDVLARYLGKAGGEPVHPTDFKPGMLPTYMQTNYRIVNAEGNEVAMGRDLSRIRRELGLRARASFTANPPPRWNRDSLKRWDFGELPESVEISHGGVTVYGYPALIDAGDSVSLRLLESKYTALESTRAGIRRLFMIQLREELRYLERTIPKIERMSLFYATIGRSDAFIDELIIAIADRAIFAQTDPATIRSHDAFAAAAEIAWRRLTASAGEVIEVVRQTLDAHQSLDIALSEDFPPLWIESIRDMRDQLAHLIHDGFISHTPFKYLQRLPRYLAALTLRLKKLSNAGLTRDMQGLKDIGPLWSSYKDEQRRRRDAGTTSDEFVDFRWQLEELRVSVFAQELKAAAPVSLQRLQRQWESILRPRSTSA
jgi:ATP-dependent helicase HrpA